MMPTVPSAMPAIDLLEAPEAGRCFTMTQRVRLGDVDRSGRMRLDATARFLQDVATDDASDAGLDRRFGWLVRRTLVETTNPATLGEPIELATWCTGIGRSWAERRTRIVGRRGAAIDAVSLWVQVDVETSRPARIATDFIDAYGAAAGGRAVSSRLSLPAPSEEAVDAHTTWSVRRTDLDPLGHVNNAATWSFLEEVGRLDETGRVGRAELEYLQPVEADDDVVVMAEPSHGATVAWLVASGAVRAAARWTEGR
jgi:acyl-ACP thioesterase